MSNFVQFKSVCAQVSSEISKIGETMKRLAILRAISPRQAALMKTLSLRLGAATRNTARKLEYGPAIFHGIKHL
jgi:hypothetical protein